MHNDYERIETPAYVFDVDRLRAHTRRIKAALGGAELCFAVKANPFLVSALADEADCFEVCSYGEYEICKSCGVPADKLVISGVYKAEHEMRSVIESCGDRAVYTAESQTQLGLLKRLAGEYALRLRVLLRLSCGNQFGMDGETLLDNVSRPDARIVVEGIQFYSGTQKPISGIKAETERLIGFAGRFAQTAGTLRRIEYGPGLKVNYFSGEKDEENDCLDALSKSAAMLAEKARTVIESGRFVCAGCGEYVTRIVDLKRTDGNLYCIVDGGINHLKYHGQTMAMKTPPVKHIGAAAGKAENWTVCGSLCTSADVLLKSMPLCGAGTGDLLVFGKAGAYSVTEGLALFLSRALPRVYKREKGEIALIRDFIRTDLLNRKGE